jgi:hypothetical protein
MEVHVPVFTVKVAPIIGTLAYGKDITGTVEIAGLPDGSVIRVTDISDTSVAVRILFPSV